MILAETLSFPLNASSNMIFSALYIKCLSNSLSMPRLAMTLLFVVAVAGGCEVEHPQKQEVPELVTTVTLTFTPISGEDPVRVTATDPDGEGVQDIAVDGPVRLSPDQTYTLEISLINGLADPTQPEYDVTEEIREEADEHIFFFSWSDNLFSNPMGDGNIDNRPDQIK